MEFDLVPSDGNRTLVYLPLLPVVFSGTSSFPLAHALVDTGADITLLPMEMAKWIGVDLDERGVIQTVVPGGGGFLAIPSATKNAQFPGKTGLPTAALEGHGLLCTAAADGAPRALSVSRTIESRVQRKEAQSADRESLTITLRARSHRITPSTRKIRLYLLE